MSKRVKAISMGFKGGRRIREGSVFFVGDNEKAKWFIDYPEKSHGPAISDKDQVEKKQDIRDLI